jgi:hypothetical protein
VSAPRAGRRRLAAVAWALAPALAVTACARLLGYDAHFTPTPQHVVDAMLELGTVSNDDVLYDLGSGDGRVVITAALRYGTRGVGIEIDPWLVARSTSAAQQAGVADRVRFVHQDLFDADLSPATVVTLYLSDALNARLRPKLLRELRPGTRVVSHEHAMGDWRPARQIHVEVHGARRPVFLWLVGR